MGMDKCDSVKPFNEYLKMLLLKGKLRLSQGKFMWKLVRVVHPNSISKKFPLTYYEGINKHQSKLVTPYCDASERYLLTSNLRKWLMLLKKHTEPTE